MNYKNIFTIAKKEIQSHLDNPTSYITLIIFVVLWQFLFFRSAFLIGEASLRGLFEYLPWLMIFFASAVTMGSLAQEKAEGTIEFLMTHPVSAVEVVAGKFLSSLVFISFGLLFSLPVAVSFSLYGNLDWGSFVGQLLSGIFLASCISSLGIFVSGFLTSQIASLIAVSAFSFLLMVSGTDFITQNLPFFLIPFFERLSFMSHVSSMSRGVIDLRDLWYFLSFTAIFISLAYLTLVKNKYGNRKDIYRSISTGIFLFIAIAIVTNVIGERIPGRIDLTRNRIYSLSPVTKKTLSNLKDIIIISFYSSSKLPSQLVPVVRDVKDILKDYGQISRGNVNVIYKDPSDNPTVANEASQRGVKEVQFNVIGSEEFQMKTGFLGIVVSYKDQHEVIPFIENTNDLEYQMTSFITKLTTNDKKTIAFLTGHGEKNLFSDLGLLKTELEKQYQVTNSTIDGTQSEIATESSVLVIAGPNLEIDESARTAVKNYLKSGKNAMFLIDSYSVAPQSLQASPNENSLADFVSEYGVKVNQNLLYDLRSNETVRMGQGAFGLFIAYPYWIRALSLDSGSQITAKVDNFILPWGSSLSLDEEKLKNSGLSAVKLAGTSEYAGLSTGTINLTPDKAVFPKENLNEHLVAAAVLGSKDADLKGRLVVVGDSDFLSDQFTQNSPQNLAFALSSISWLSSDEALAGIKIKNASGSKLIFNSSFDPAFIKWANLLLAVFFPGGIGLYRLIRRKKLRLVAYID